MDTTQWTVQQKIINPFLLGRDDHINDPQAIQKKIKKQRCKSLISKRPHAVIIPFSLIQSLIPAPTILWLQMERGDRSHPLKKKKHISLLPFPSIPSAPPPPASSLHPIKFKPCVLLLIPSQSELTMKPTVYIWWQGGRRRLQWVGRLILKGDMP